MTVIIQNTNSELQPCSEMCPSLQSFVYKVPWGSQSLRMFYMKELFLSYNICYIICEWNTLFVPFYNLKLIWHVFLHFSLPGTVCQIEVAMWYFLTSLCPKNLNFPVLLNVPLLLLRVAQTGNRWQQWVSDATNSKAEKQWSNLSITNENKLKAAVIDTGYQ